VVISNSDVARAAPEANQNPRKPPPNRAPLAAAVAGNGGDARSGEGGRAGSLAAAELLRAGAASSWSRAARLRTAAELGDAEGLWEVEEGVVGSLLETCGGGDLLQELGGARADLGLEGRGRCGLWRLRLAREVAPGRLAHWRAGGWTCLVQLAEHGRRPSAASTGTVLEGRQLGETCG
jgi:hypothetical protein